MDANADLNLDDELLAEFINESREHLTAIEAELLAIEEGGENIDAELVNKVFRAAHSIKGASGYFGLNKVKELAHRAETVLDMIRSRKMVPNLLLAAFDKLREMINRPAESANADIDELVLNLTGLASSYLPQEKKASLTQTVTLQLEGGGAPVVLSKFDYERSKECGNYLYSVEYDLIHDIERRGKVPILCGGTAFWVEALLLGTTFVVFGDLALFLEFLEIGNEPVDFLRCQYRRRLVE